MTDGVEEDSKTYSRLELRFRRAESQRESLAFVEVVNEKVEMKTLGLWPFGPCGGSDVGDFLKPDGRVTIVQEFDPRHVLRQKVTERLDLEPTEL